MENSDKRRFEMTEPVYSRVFDGAYYVFTLVTDNVHLIDCMANYLCVASVKRINDLSLLVGIKTTYDADEAWHFIRSEMEKEAELIYLDKIWEDALWL